MGAFVFQSDRDGDFEILQAQPDGSIRRLTDNSTLDIEPSVSRDGRIAFASSRAGNAEIFVLGPASTLRLTTNAFRDSQPTWSPDARRIAFRSARGGNNDIYIANSDGSPQPDGARDKRLTVTTNFESDPSFGADGRIYFVSDRAFGAQPAGTPHIFSMTSEGTDVRQITQGPANDFGPALSRTPAACSSPPTATATWSCIRSP